MDRAIAAIPTFYNGIRFRSRLEARWAAFFDMLGWDWAYEPIDLKGYIPDFIVRGVRTPLLIEVKPIVDIECAHWQELAQCNQKAIDAGWQGDIVIVGASPYLLGRAIAIGALELRDPHVSIVAQVGLCLCCAGFSIGSVHDSDEDDDNSIGHTCIFCGCSTFRDEKAEHRGHFYPLVDVIERFWAVASNQTQWRGSQNS